MPLATIFVVSLLLLLSPGGASAYPASTPGWLPDGQQSSLPDSQQKTPPEPGPTEPSQTPPPSGPAPDNASQSAPSEQAPPKPEAGQDQAKQQPAPGTAQPAQNPQPESATPPHETSQAKPKVKPKTIAPKKTTQRRKKRPPTANSTASPPKVVVPNGGATDSSVRISPSVSAQQKSSERQKVDQLLTTTDGKLKKLAGRQLNSSQQDMVRQAQVYMTEAKTAAAGGDFERANNLAVKASLLADELSKP